MYMAQLLGKALLPPGFMLQHTIPAFLQHPKAIPGFAPFAYRKYFPKRDPEKDVPVGMLSLRVNEVCNLRCSSCGQWGENGHLRKKLENGEKLDQLDFEVVKRLIYETKKDRPFYYIWGGEPTMWKPLLPVFQELGKNNLYASIVTNSQALEPMLEELIDTGALGILYLSLDGWDADSQNLMRSPASGKKSDNFERTMRVIEKTDELKKKKGLKFPFVIPITVISNENYSRLAQIHSLVRDRTQLHPYYYGWFIPEDRAREHEKDFKARFGYEPKNHKGYLKSCFNKVDAHVTAQQVRETKRRSKGHQSVPLFIPDFSSEAQIKRYYDDHAWDCGYSRCESIYVTAEISPDGRITPCRDYQDYTAGNINEDSFYDIWNGENFKEFRRQMEKGLMPVCTRCCGLQGF